jgi:uncharacterized iron-regulated protein
MAKVTLTVEQGKPLQIHVEDAVSPEQVLWMLAQAQVVILTEEQADEEMQELPDELDEKEEADVPNV